MNICRLVIFSIGNKKYAKMEYLILPQQRKGDQTGGPISNVSKAISDSYYGDYDHCKGGFIMIYKLQDQVCLTSNQLNMASSILGLWVEDAVWTRAYVISTINNLPNQTVTEDRVLQIPTAFYNVLKVFWGEEIALQYMNYMNERIAHERDLLNALIRGDQESADMHTRMLYENADGISAFFDQFPRWDKNVWQQLLYSDIRMYINQITAILSGNYAEEITIFDNIINNAISMGNFMSLGILTRPTI